MRTISKSLLLAAACVASVAGHLSPARGHDVGDCVVGAGFSDCRQYLTSLGAIDGFNYLSETTCPPCVQGSPQSIGMGGTVFYRQMCPKNKGWSDPQDSNLATANQHFDDATEDQTGAIIDGFDERICWKGGECVEGECEGFLDSSNSITYPVLNFRCPRTGGRIWYVIKVLGNTCEPEEEEEEEEEDEEQEEEDSGEF